MKRLDRDGHVTTVPRPKAEPYLYMPNPVLIHTESAKIRHFLAIAQFYIDCGQPEIYEVEPSFDPEYIPDVYTRIDGVPILVEVQRTHTSNRRMQQKIDGFVRTYREGKHDARTLWIISNERFQLDVPAGFTVEQKRKEQVS